MLARRRSFSASMLAISALAAPLFAASPRYLCGAFDPTELTNVVYVSATEGKDSRTCGASLLKQCKSIAQGISNCNKPNCAVLVAYDRYSLPTTVNLRTGVHL